MTTPPRVTIKDVAARAGVSKGAVSLAFNHKPGLADATRDRIFEAARELGWAPNLAARSLSNRRVDVIGLAICRRRSCSGSNRSTWSSSRAWRAC